MRRIRIFKPKLPLDLLRWLPPGAWWITVRPNGPGTDGHPVLIQPAGDGLDGGADAVPRGEVAERIRGRKDRAETSVLFELIGRRYERRSALITANQPFAEWNKVFPDPAMTIAAVVVEMNVDSYRQKAAPRQSGTTIIHFQRTRSPT